MQQNPNAVAMAAGGGGSIDTLTNGVDTRSVFDREWSELVQARVQIGTEIEQLAERLGPVLGDGPTEPMPNTMPDAEDGTDRA